MSADQTEKFNKLLNEPSHYGERFVTAHLAGRSMPSSSAKSTSDKRRIRFCKRNRCRESAIRGNLNKFKMKLRFFPSLNKLKKFKYLICAGMTAHGLRSPLPTPSTLRANLADRVVQIHNAILDFQTSKKNLKSVRRNRLD